MVEACETQNRQPKILQGSIKTGKQGEFREGGGPGLKSGLDSIHLSDLGNVKGHRGPLTKVEVVMTSALTSLHLSG